MSGHRGRLVGAAVAAGTLVAGLAAIGGPAGAVVSDPVPIGPHQPFIGLVNARSTGAVIAVVCPIGALVGRALPNQTLEVVRPAVVSVKTGNTGSRGHRIVASVLPTPSTAAGVAFSSYYVTKEFPTNLPVPCRGAGIIRFNPAPGSTTAVPYDVSVTWGNVTAS
jgi:hypothetical protein